MIATISPFTCRGGRARPEAPVLARAGLLLLLFVITGCDQSGPAVSEGSGRPPGDAPAPAPWQTVEGSPQVAVPSEEEGGELAQAIEAARSTMEDARTRWQHGGDEERGKWAVKWRSPTLDGGTEYVWVQPLSWSAFRIEGELANPPQRPLLAGADLGDVVSFPIEEAVDWVYFFEGDPEGAREGGFTIDVLEKGTAGRRENAAGG